MRCVWFQFDHRCTVQALNDSGLGEALIGGGLMDELRQPVFSLGLKGVDPKDCKKVPIPGRLNSRLPARNFVS